MNWLKRKIAKWINDGDLLNRYGTVHEEKATNAVVGSSAHFKNPLNITLYNAIGGRIVKFHHYNETTDRSEETVYLIGLDENLVEALTKFIATEAIKNI